MTPTSYDNAGSPYLEQLLRAAIHGETARNEPEAGRIVAGLMLALVEQGAGDRVSHYLCPAPDGMSNYEVTCFDDENRPVSRVEHLDASDAIRIAVRLAGGRPDATAAVVAGANSGRQRCVLLANSSGISFQFPKGRISPEDSLESGEEAADIEETARPVDPRVDSSPAAPDEQDIAILLASVVPSATEIADLVVERLSARSIPHDTNRQALGRARRPRGTTPAVGNKPQQPRQVEHLRELRGSVTELSSRRRTDDSVDPWAARST